VLRCISIHVQSESCDISIAPGVHFVLQRFEMIRPVPATPNSFASATASGGRRSRSSRWRQSTCSPTSRSSRASCWARPFSVSQPGSFQRSPQGRAFERLVQEPENPVSRRHRSLRGTCDPSVDLLTWEGVRQASSRLSGDTRRIRLMLARKSSQRCSWCRALKLSRAISRTAFRANRSSISSADPRSG
jgi:hypothetical protein